MNDKTEISPAVLGRARAIRLVAFDVDGVLTDGGLLSDGAREYQRFNVRDGHGFKMLHKHGVRTAIISGRSSRAVSSRAAELGVEMVYQGQADKAAALERLLAESGLALAQIAYVGDDVVDLPVLCRVGLAVAVNDAHPLVLEHCHWQTPRAGGRGAGRDVCELILRAQDLYPDEMRGYMPAPGAA